MQLLEREPQLQTLESALREVKDGSGRVALIYGEAGIGKTSLVEHFLEQHQDSWRILRGACDSLFTPRPLGPLHDVAVQSGGDLLSLFESGSDRNAIFSASLIDLGGQPTIMVVEDLHWADEATLDWLKYLGRRIRQIPALLILTYRDDEIGADHPLRLLLGDLGTSATVRRIPVPALSEGALVELARDKKVDAAELHRVTNGNPFFITEVLAAESGLPETVRDAVLTRAARLSPAAREVLEAAAVIGLRVEPWLVLQLADSAAAQIEECIAAGMLQLKAEYYTFRHELTRQTILDSMTPHRKAALHRRALEGLRTRAETREHLPRLADHAAGTQDAELVLKYSSAAGREASAAGSHREAVAHFERALRFAGRLPSAEHAEMLEAYVLELVFAGRFHDAAPACQKAAAMREAAGDAAAQGYDLANLGIIYYHLSRQSESEAACRAAISVLEARPAGPELARAYNAQCFLLMEDRQCAQAVHWGRKAIDLAEKLGDAETLARAYNYCGCAQMLLDYDRGLELMRRSQDLGLQSNLPFTVGGTLVNQAQIAIEVFRFKDAHSALKDAIPYASDHDDDFHWRSSKLLEALLWIFEGHWAQAESTLTSILDTHGTDLITRTYTLNALGRLRVRRGQSAIEQLHEALALSQQSAALPRMAYSRAARAEAAWLAGDTAKAAREANVVYEMAVTKHHPWITGELAFWRWRGGDEFTPPEWTAEPFTAQIGGDWRRAAELWEQLGCPYEQGMALMDGDEAAQLEALQIFQRLGARPIIEKLKQQMRGQGIRRIPRGPRPSTRENAFGLTVRELEVLSAMITGATNSVIAGQLSLSTRTVEHHLASILQKTGTQSRSQAVALALREHLVTPQ